MTRIAIIGAGIAGLTLARQLNNYAEVIVFEKSPGHGGRMATRSPPPYAFDHGAQFFTAKSQAFKNQVSEWIQLGIVQSWNVRFAEFERNRIVAARDWDDGHPHYVGVPGMNHIGKHLAQGIQIKPNARVMPLQRSGIKWTLQTDNGEALGQFDWVISTAPAAQTAALLPDCSFKPAVDKKQMRGCCALMLGFPSHSRPLLDWQAALIREADISWASVNSSKPGRGEAFSMVVHSTNAYADVSLHSDPATVQAHLLNELRLVTGIDTDKTDHCALHRWRYANIPQQNHEAALLDPALKLGVCGDWLIHGRIEAAYLSATQLADSVLRHLR